MGKTLKLKSSEESGQKAEKREEAESTVCNKAEHCMELLSSCKTSKDFIAAQLKSSRQPPRILTFESVLYSLLLPALTLCMVDELGLIYRHCAVDWLWRSACCEFCSTNLPGVFIPEEITQTCILCLQGNILSNRSPQPRIVFFHGTTKKKYTGTLHVCYPDTSGIERHRCLTETVYPIASWKVFNKDPRVLFSLLPADSQELLWLYQQTHSDAKGLQAPARPKSC